MRFVQFYYSYLSESALNGCSLDQQQDPNPSLASETLGNGRRIPALLFSWNVLPSFARWSNTSGQLRYSSMGEFEESIIQKFCRYMTQDNDPNRFYIKFFSLRSMAVLVGRAKKSRWAREDKDSETARRLVREQRGFHFSCGFAARPWMLRALLRFAAR